MRRKRKIRKTAKGMMLSHMFQPLQCRPCKTKVAGTMELFWHIVVCPKIPNVDAAEYIGDMAAELRQSGVHLPVPMARAFYAAMQYYAWDAKVGEKEYRALGLNRAPCPKWWLRIRAGGKP